MVAVCVAAAEVEAVCVAVCVAVWVDARVGAEEVVAESVACGVFVLVPVAAADWVPDGEPVAVACADEEAVAELEQDGTFDIPVVGQPPLRPLHVHGIAAAAPAGQKEPTGQVVATPPLPPVQYEPAGHAAHEVAPLA